MVSVMRVRPPVRDGAGRVSIRSSLRRPHGSQASNLSVQEWILIALACTWLTRVDPRDTPWFTVAETDG